MHMAMVAAIWHNPGGPNGVGRGDYPVVILGFDGGAGQLMGPGMRAFAVDTAGRLWAISADQLTVRDEQVLGKLNAVAAQLAGGQP
jgi:hypothetical protein